MPKICEICKQPYDDTLTSCPNCDIVDIFGSTAPTVPQAGAGTTPQAAAPAKPGAAGADLPPTKFQGPIPPVGGTVRPASAAQPGKAAPATPPAPSVQSPLMARAMEGTKPAAAQPPVQGKATNLPSGTQGQPTMVGPQGGVPTMVAPQGGQPTMVAKQVSPPTMIAPEGAAAAEAGAAPAAGKQPSAVKPPAAAAKQPPAAAAKQPPAAAPGKGQAVPTMLPRGAAQPTQVAKQSSQPTMIAPEGAAQAEAGAGQAKKTQMPQGAGQPTQLQKRGEKTMVMPPEEMPGGAAAGPADPKKTQMPKGASQPTMLAKSTEPTKLAPEGTEAMDLPEGYAPTGDPKKKTQMPQGAKQSTMLAQAAARKTVLEGADAQPMDLPADASKKKTMMARGADPTKLAPPDAGAMELPEGYDSPKKTSLPPQKRKTVLDDPSQQPMDIPGKKTVLPAVAKKTTLDAPGTDPLLLPGKKTAMPGPAQPTTLVPPEEAEPMDIPGGIAQTLEAGPGSTGSLSGEMARQQLEGGKVDMGLDSSSRYDTAPTTPPVQPGYKKRWFGGMVIGLLLAAGILAALWTFKEEEPVVSWLAALGLRPLRPDPVPLETAIQWLDEGRIQDAFLVLEKAGDDPKVQGVRGEARWFYYLQKNQGKGDITDGDVKTALGELEVGKNGPDPILARRAEVWPGHIQERLGTSDAAVKLYGSAASKHKEAADPFKAGADRTKGYPIKAGEKAKPPENLEKDKAKDADKDKAKDSQAQAPMTENEMLEIMALLLTAQQAAAPPINIAKSEPEAGALFWEAVRLAQEGNYSAALKALQASKERHSTVRFTRLKKAQNPLTDPTEEIFLKSVDDMYVYWRILDRLKSDPAKYDMKDPLAALEIVLKSRGKPDEILMQVAKALGINNPKPQLGEIVQAIEALELDRKIAGDVRKALADNKVLNEDQLKDNKEVEKAAKTFVDGGVSNIKIAELVKTAKPKVDGATTDEVVKNLVKDYNDLWVVVTQGTKKLFVANYLGDEKYEKEKFLKGIDDAIEAAVSPLVSAMGRTLTGFTKFTVATPAFPSVAAYLQGELSKSQLANEVLTGRLKLARSSRQMLEFWLPVVSNKEQKEVKDVGQWAAQDARHVLDDKLATATDKAAAHAINGMVNRLDGKFDDARTALNEAVKTGKGDNEGKWRGFATGSLKELTDPTAYYLPRGEELQSTGYYNRSLEVLNAGVGAFPNDGRMLALRSQVTLDQARSQAKAPLTLAHPQVAAARRDADAAVAAGAQGEGNYALGRVFEDINDPVAAEAAYRRALQANPAANQAGTRYRVALGRVMLKLNPLPGAPPIQIPAPANINRPAANKVGQLLPTDNKLDLQTSLVLLLTGLVADDETPDLDEIIRLADIAIKAKNYEGYLIKAGALARKGMWTEALKMYSEGLRYLVPDNYSRGLSEIVNNHPAFNLPDPLRNPDPLRAERHYSAGLRFYFAGMFPQAEQEFTEAYRNQGQDARILYYLGLSKLPQQGKRQAALVNFQMASILEQQNKPSPAAVNSSLERIQGELRRYLNAYRP